MINVVFGGSQGIGSYCSEELQKDSKVLIIDKNNPKIKSFDFIQCDLSVGNQLEYVIDELLKVDLNSIIWSIRYRAESKKSIAESIKDNLNVSLFPLVKIVERLEKHLIKSGTRIIIISSINSNTISSMGADYYIKCAASEAYAKYLSAHLGDTGRCSINIIRAGIVRFPDKFTYDRYKEILERSAVPAGKIHTAEEIAKMLKFLCGLPCGAYNGSVINIDSGESNLDQYWVAQRAIKEYTKMTESNE